MQMKQFKKCFDVRCYIRQARKSDRNGGGLAQVSILYRRGDRKEPSNYRPISLLNVGAKLGPKILAHQLGRVYKLSLAL